MAYPTKSTGRAAYWRQQLDFSKKQLEPWMKIGDRQLELYENEATTEREMLAEGSDLGSQNIGRVKPSLTYGWIDQSISNMLSRNPTFRATAKTRDAADGEVPVAKTINYWFTETDQKHQDQRVLLDAFVYPFGLKKIGWSADVRGLNDADFISQSADPEMVFDDPEDENLFLGVGTPTVVLVEQNHVKHAEKHGELLSDPDIDEEIKENIIAPHIKEHQDLESADSVEAHVDIQMSAPYGIRWRPRDFRIDPLAQDGLKDARWVAFGAVKPLDEVRATQTYNKAALKKLRPSRIQDAPEVNVELGDDDGFSVVTLWEIWIRSFAVSATKRADLLVVLAEGGDGGEDLILQHQEGWPEGYDTLEDFPAEMLRFGMGNKTWLQKPILALSGFDNIQQIQNEILDSFLNVIRKQKNILFYDSDIFQEDQVEMALAAPDATAIDTPGLSQAPGMPIMALPFLNIPGEKGSFLDLIHEMANNAAGMPMPGMSEPGTATEAAIEERRTSAREGRRLSLFEDYQIGTAQKFWRLHTQFKPDIERFIDAEVPDWSDVSDSMLKGNYRFHIDISSRVTALAVERKQWLDLLNLLSAMGQPGDPNGPKLPKIAEQLLRRGYDIQNPAELWPAIEQQLEQGPIDITQMADMLSGQTPPGPEPGVNGGGPTNPQQFNAPVPDEIAQIREGETL